MLSPAFILTVSRLSIRVFSVAFSLTYLAEIAVSWLVQSTAMSIHIRLFKLSHFKPYSLRRGNVCYA